MPDVSCLQGRPTLRVPKRSNRNRATSRRRLRSLTRPTRDVMPTANLRSRAAAAAAAAACLAALAVAALLHRRRRRGRARAPASPGLLGGRRGRRPRRACEEEEKPQARFRRVVADNSYSAFKHLRRQGAGPVGSGHHGSEAQPTSQGVVTLLLFLLISALPCPCRCVVVLGILRTVGTLRRLRQD